MAKNSEYKWKNKRLKARRTILFSLVILSIVVFLSIFVYGTWFVNTTLSDDFSNNNFDTSLWVNNSRNNGNLTEAGGAINLNTTTSASGMGILGFKKDFKDGLTYLLNFSYSLNSSSGLGKYNIMICNSTNPSDTYTGRNTEALPTETDCKYLVYGNSSTAPIIYKTIIINATSGNATHYNADGSFNSTKNISGLGNWYWVINNYANSVESYVRLYELNVYNYVSGISTSLLSPANNYNSPVLTNNFNINATVNAVNLTNITLFIYNQTGGINYSETKVFNTNLSSNWTFTRTLDVGSWNWTGKSCGINISGTTICDTSINSTLNILRIVEHSQLFNSTTYESSLENFNINISYDSSIYVLSNSYLVYNGTSYTASQTGLGEVILYKNLVTTSFTAVSSNVSFYWNISLTSSLGTYYYISTINSQIINKGTALFINNTCPTGYSPTLNFSFYYEQNLTAINASSVRYSISYGLSGNSSANQINNTLTNIDKFSICINNSQTYYNVGYGEIQYSVPGSVDRRYYLFQNQRLTNTTVSIPLYNLEVSPIATSFLFTAETTSLQPYIGYYIGLLRWYPATNNYQIVEMGKTDDKGQTILRVKSEDVDYRIGIYQPDGTLVKLLDPIKFICQTNPCTYSIFVDAVPLDLTTYTNIQQSLTYDSTTKIFTFIWNDPSQLTQQMNLTVYKQTGIGEVIVCSSVAASYTGVLICDVSAQTGTMRAEAVRTASPPVTMAQLVIQIKQLFSDVGGGSLGLFIGAILLIFMAFIGIFSPVIVIVLGCIAMIPLFIMGNISIAVLTGIGVLGGIIIHFIIRGSGK